MEQPIGKCFLCKKDILRSKSDEWVFHESKGYACIKHKGVERWYEELLKEAE